MSAEGFFVDDGIDKIGFKKFFNGLVRYLCEDKPLKNRIVKVLKSRKKSNGQYTDQDYLTFVPITYKGEKVTVLLTTEDIYVIGFKVKGKYYVISKDPSTSTHRKSVESCLNMHEQLPIQFLDVAHSYQSLETLAEKKRGQILIGKKALLDALDYLVTAVEIKECPMLGLSIIVFSQMISESIRIRILAEFVENNFEAGDYIPERILFLEHAWSTASKILLEEQPGDDDIELYYVDLSKDNRLTYQDLRTVYGALKNYDVSMLNGEISEFDKLITWKYLHACYGKQIRKLELFDMGSNYQVTVAVHIYEKNLMLQYNYDGSLSDACVTVGAPPEYFMESAFQPIKSFPYKIFVAFEEISGEFSSATFSTTLCGKHDDMDVKESLKDFKVAPKDYITGLGFVKFTKTWDNLKTTPVESTLQLPQSLTVEEAKRLVIDLLNVEDVTKQAGNKWKWPYKGQQTPTLYYGKYRNVYDIFVQTTFDIQNQRVEKIFLTAKCSNEKFCKVIDNIMKDWITASISPCSSLQPT